MLGRTGIFASLALAVLLLSTPAKAVLRDLPADVEAALNAAHVPRDALALVVQEVGAAQPHLAWRADAPVNPASLMKLVTTAGALDLLGPAWNWTTPVWLDGPVHDGVLEGNLVIKGSGDPKLTLERMWLMLRRVQQLGVREIRGDIVLDRSAFGAVELDPAAFDGEPLRPQNVQPDALLLNFRSVLIGFVPDPARGVAQIVTEPPLAGVQVDASVPLSDGPCRNWRAALKADFSDPARLRFAGSYPTACTEQQWPLAAVDPTRYNERMLLGLWREMGGTLAGTVRDGVAPMAPASFSLTSPSLPELIRDINKFSSNVMAQQLFLTLGFVHRGAGTPEASRAVLHHWLLSCFGASALDVVIDNGSGLSRNTRLSAGLLARVLHAGWASPTMPELVASLPVSGVDGTMRRARGGFGRAHLKTGSLRDVAAVAGFVHAESGRRYVLVAIVNHPNANAARPALEALVEWVAADARPERRTLE
jgi:D-alanyl-D-alanine carboxypeptidase/D-alanyl-D-alanine-endopeptidase (penicillin-binding protein 4)